MDLGIKGKVAMVAASSKGIGLAIAQVLSAEGALVSICGRHDETLTPAEETLVGESRSYVVDVSSGEDLQWWYDETVKDLGPVDILVTNTGGPAAGNWTEKTDEEWSEGFRSTLMNVVRLVRLVHEGMRDRNWGRIVHITSLVAREPVPLLPISATFRTGLMSLTRLQATELAPFGITVNGVLPGHTLTDRQTHLAEIRATQAGITVDEALRQQGEAIPAKRLAQPEEIADAVAFLCSQRAAYITGTSLLVDGGLTKSPA